jgi:hypothetical protein
MPHESRGETATCEPEICRVRGWQWRTGEDVSRCPQILALISGFWPWGGARPFLEAGTLEEDRLGVRWNLGC